LIAEAPTPAITFEQASNQRQRARTAGMDPNYWYAVAQERSLQPGQVAEVTFWNTSIAVFRGKDGQLGALENRCGHRQLKLSLGQVEDCTLVCQYHGWRYASDGRVVHFPHDLFDRPKLNVRVRSYPLRVRYGLIWLFPGDPSRAIERDIPDIPELEGPRPWACVPIEFTWRAHHSMIVDNVSDFTHEYLHRKYKPFVDAKLTRCEAVDDKVYVGYNTRIGAGRFTNLFVDRDRASSNSIQLCYDYPYQWSNTDGRIKHWCFLLPIDEQTTRVFFLFYYDAIKIPLLNRPMPQRLLQQFLKIANPFIVKPLLRQDGFAVEAEQDGWTRHFDQPMIEINPAVHMFQALTIRKWEEHLANQARMKN